MAIKKKTGKLPLRVTVEKPRPAPEEKSIQAYLISTPRGIDLHVTDAGGADWFVASLNTEGELYLYSSIPDDIGLSVDERGFIEVVREGGAS
jgi:hypothetical protein